MAVGPGIRCENKGVAPAPGMWDYDRTQGNGVAFSVVVFQWISTKDGSGVIRDRIVKRYSGKINTLDSLSQKAEVKGQELEKQPEVAKYDDPRVRINVASAVNASTETLASLSDDKDARVRIEVAKHRNTDSYTLEKLSGDSNSDVRAAVARNPNISGQVRTTLGKDRVGTVVTAARQAIRFAKQSK
jgi:hypothetical protein